MKPNIRRIRKAGKGKVALEMEDQMRGLGKVFLTGAAAVVLWKLFAALFIGILGMALKVALVVGVIYLAMKIFQNNKEQKEE